MSNENHQLTEGIERRIRGKTVMVTGADGFMGSHLTDALVRMGARVHAFVRAGSSGELYNIRQHKGRIAIHRGDLADRHAVASALQALKDSGDKPIIFHMAAQAHVGESWERPYETMYANVLGTLNILQAIRDLDVDLEKIVVSGTSEEYGNVDPEMREHYRFVDGSLVLDEKSPVNPKSVYAVSKVAADFLTRDYHGAYGIPGVVTRMFNNYGPRQNPRYITPTVITQALSRDTIELGYLKAKRDFCYCEDGVLGHLAVALHGAPGEVYVYGQGENVSVGAWTDLILSVGAKAGHWNLEDKKVVTTPSRGRLGSTEVEELRVDYRKLRELTGWKPTHSWEDGIRKTIQWYVDHPDKWMGRVDWK